MKIFLMVFILIISFMSCDECESQEKPFFNSADLSKLSLDKIDSFWDDDSIKHVSDFIDETFNTHLEYLVGTRYSSDSKIIAVSVFNSQYGAIEAMELRRNNVAAVIIEGDDHLLITEKWWYSDGIPNIVFVNQWNTIVEIGYYHPNYEEVEELLIEAAGIVAEKIDSLSN